MIFEAYDTGKRLFWLDAPDLETAIKRAKTHAEGFVDLPSGDQIVVFACPRESLPTGDDAKRLERFGNTHV